MQTVAHLDTHVDPAHLFEVIKDLDGYDKWLDIVGRVAPLERTDTDPGPAWSVDLRAQIGPLRRSKRLRMVRTHCIDPEDDAPGTVGFERREVDGRSHSAWALTGVVTGVDRGVRAGAASAVGVEASRLEMTLFYGGSLWVPMMERMLREEIERSRPRLLEQLGGR